MDNKVLTDRVNYVIVNLEQTLHPRIEELDIIPDILSGRVIAFRMSYEYRGVQRYTTLYMDAMKYPSDEALYLEAFRRAESRTQSNTAHVDYMFDNGHWTE